MRRRRRLVVRLVQFVPLPLPPVAAARGSNRPPVARVAARSVVIFIADVQPATQTRVGKRAILVRDAIVLARQLIGAEAGAIDLRERRREEGQYAMRRVRQLSK